jgi:hypothetical protein
LSLTENETKKSFFWNCVMLLLRSQ